MFRKLYFFPSEAKCSISVPSIPVHSHNTDTGEMPINIGIAGDSSQPFRKRFGNQRILVSSPAKELFERHLKPFFRAVTFLFAVDNLI